nr:transporter substrate-binding domain-containing protein [Nitrosomonas nitrosa]
MKEMTEAFTGRLKASARILAAASAIAATLAISAQGAFAVTLSEIEARGLNVATEDNYYPFEFITNGAPDGFHKDVIAELREYASFEIHQEILPWTGFLAALQAGKYDAAITGAGVTEDRLTSFNYAPPVALGNSWYVKRAGDDRIKSIADLSGLTFGLQAGGAQIPGLKQLEATLATTGGTLGRVVEYQAYPEAYADLANGRLDYVLNGAVPSAVIVKERPTIFELGEATTGPVYVAWPVAKGNDEILQYLTDFMTHLRETGKLEELQQKWFGMTFPDLPQEPITSVEQLRQLSGSK